MPQLPQHLRRCKFSKGEAKEKQEPRARGSRENLFWILIFPSSFSFPHLSSHPSLQLQSMKREHIFLKHVFIPLLFGSLLWFTRVCYILLHLAV